MYLATLGTLLGGVLIGAGFYWAFTPDGVLGSMEPYIGYESFRQMRFWVWVKFLAIAIPVAIFFPGADPDYPLAQTAYGATLAGFTAFHCRFLATSEATWDERAGVRPFPDRAQ